MMEIGTILANRYQICELLSHKAGRLTLLARDLHSQTLAIVKILRFDRDFLWDDLKLFEREAATLQHLDRPEIPKYLDYFEVESADTRGFALVQSYIDAPSLETLVKQGRKFSETEIIELADRLLDLLTYLHQQHPPVIHRDIKPSNILLGNRSGKSVGDVYLVDFGSVQTVARKEEGTITIVGSYGYIPLEQFGGQTTTASDLYSLGMTLIYLLTGSHPAELPQINGRVKFTAEISTQFKRWLEKMTQPHLDKRFDSARSARIALTSKDGSYGDFTELKPANSKVQLYRDRDRLEIRWQDIDREKIANFEKIAAIPGFVATTLIPPVIIGFWFSAILPSIGWLAGVAFIGTFIGCFLSILIYYTVLPIVRIFIKPIDRIFTIDELYFYHCTAKLGKNKSRIISQHPRSSINILAYNPGYVFDRYLDENRTVVSRGTITVSPKLYLYCNKTEYNFSERLSQAELWWLGKELSDFLNLELQVIYPTPKVPPAPNCGGGC